MMMILDFQRKLWHLIGSSVDDVVVVVFLFDRFVSFVIIFLVYVDVVVAISPPPPPPLAAVARINCCNFSSLSLLALVTATS